MSNYDLLGGGAGDGPPVKAKSGRIFYRHSSNLGTVMEFVDYDKKTKKVLIPDAKYRGKSSWGVLNHRISLPSISGSGITLSANATDDYLNSSRMPKDTNSSKVNCDTWLKDAGTYRSADGTYTVNGVPCVEFARSIKINGIGCDIPNINILARIWCDADTIDSMDKTADSYPYLLLGTKNPHGKWVIINDKTYYGEGASGNSLYEHGVYSSTQYSYYNWNMYKTGRLYYGQCNNADMNYGSRFHILALIPVLEIN